MCIKRVLPMPRSLWQSAYLERLIGAIRREYLDPLVTLGRNRAAIEACDCQLYEDIR